MGFKDLFIERQPVEEPRRFVPQEEQEQEPMPVEVPDNNTASFVEDVYEKNGMTDLSRSIFKVEELASTLPAEMPDKTKRQTVMSIMSTFGLSLESVVEDGYNRVQCLENSRDILVDVLDSEIQENENSIESLKLQIAELQKENSMKQAQISSIKDVSTKETDRIKILIEFIGKESQ